MKVLFIGAHPDDIEISCGGTISKLYYEGQDITWLILSDCNESLPKDKHGQLVSESSNSAFTFGDIKLIRGCYPVRQFKEHRALILDDLVELRNSLNPEMVFCHNPSDIHQDHSTVGGEAIRAFNRKASIIFYGSSYNLPIVKNNYYVKLSEQDVENKLNSLKCYQSQVELKRTYFSDEYIKGLMAVYGIEIGCDYAEAFEIFKLSI
jgi:LmbE family N-acetylglucosaminyl deacetylase